MTNKNTSPFLSLSTIYYLAIIALAILAIRSLFIPEFFPSHDANFHLSKLAQHITLLGEGQFPPRWSGTLNGGVGYPVFVYSYPLPFILGNLFYLLGANLGQSLELVFGLSFIISGISMYQLLKEYFSHPASFLGSIFFLYAPYRFSLIFVRGAVGETLALMFLPLILWSISKIFSTGQKKYTLLAGAYLGLAILSHSLFLPIYFPIILVFTLLAPYLTKTPSKFTNYRQSLLSLIIGLGLSSYYLFNLLFERKYIIFDKIYTNLAPEHLVTINQLLHSPWGFGPSLPKPQVDGMSFQLGLTQITVFLGSLCLLGLTYRKTFKSFLQKIIVFKNPISKYKKKIALLASFLFILGIILMLDTSLTVWIWENLPGINVIDFPWRFLGVTTFAGSLLASFFVEHLRFKKITITLLLLLVLYANRNHLGIKSSWQIDEQSFFKNQETTTTADEFMPIWRDGQSYLNPKKKVESENESTIKVTTNKSGLVIFTSESQIEQQIQFNNLYFPDWKGYIKEDNNWQPLILGKNIAIVNDTWGSYKPEDIKGTMRLTIPPGNQEIMMRFEETTTRKIGNSITLITALYIIINLLKISTSYRKSS